MIGSYIRFILGIILSAEVIRLTLVGESLSLLATILAVLFIFFSVLFFIFRF